VPEREKTTLKILIPKMLQQFENIEEKYHKMLVVLQHFLFKSHEVGQPETCHTRI
jgi:hypothetical protein